MTTRKIYQALAEAFVAEGARMQFGLLGDGNMHWATAMEAEYGVDTIHVRHEHCAVGAAMGYHSATGEVGIASVTCGPGFTQTMTALTSAARGNVPLVLFAGEAPVSARWYLQRIDQAPLATACGAHYIAAHSPQRMHQYVREAFYTARYESRPVVLGVPYDLQKLPVPDLGPYAPSAELLPQYVPLTPDPAQIETLAELLANAECPVFVAGRGVVKAKAAGALEALADSTGAMLSNTLLVRGLYDHHPHSLGICGGYSTEAAREVLAEADLVIAFGASLSYQTLDGGKLFPRARVVQVDLKPLGFHNGLRSADTHIVADAGLAIAALARAIEKTNPRASVRSPALSQRLRELSADSAVFEIDDGTLDPRAVFAELEKVLPKDYDMVSGSGHQAYFHAPMRGYDPTKYHHMREFGAVGNSLSYALGVAAARGNGRVVLCEGDGSLLMHIQELETFARHGIKFLAICTNDGAFGSEIHKLRADGLTDRNAVFGRPDFAAIARGFGLAGATVTDVAQLGPLMAEYEAQDSMTIWNVPVSDKVTSPVMRERLAMGHGVR